MNIVKKNLVSIICGVIALLAVVASFWPLGSIKSDLEAKFHERIAVYNKLYMLSHQTRKLPSVDPENPTQDNLTVFPSEAIIAKGKDAKQRVVSESQGMLATAIQLNKHSVLVPGSLPSPVGTAAFRFRDEYIKAMSNYPSLIHAGVSPTAADIERAKKTMWETKYQQQLISTNNATADATIKRQVELSYAKESSLLANQLKYSRAQEILLYIDPTALDTNSQINANLTAAPSPVSIWEAQLGYWIHEDIANTILSINTPYKNVIEAPVKHLVKIKIMYDLRSISAAPQPADATAAPPKQYNISPSGRICNPLYDVIRFNLVVNVEADKIPLFLKELDRNRFITVNQMDIVGLDSAFMAAPPNNFIYGNRPVVQLNLQCEAILLRAWTVPLMPVEIKKQLGIAVEASNPG